jgi:hypothetical protein
MACGSAAKLLRAIAHTQRRYEATRPISLQIMQIHNWP